MLAERRLDLAALVARYAADRSHATVAEVIAAHPILGAVPPRSAITAALVAAGLARGYALTGRRREHLLMYENWLNLAVRHWAEGRRCLTVDQFCAAHPDYPSCRVTRRAIAETLERLGYTRAYVRA